MQREIIKSKTSVNPPPTELILVKVEHATGCTCGVSNIGLIVGTDQIEIPTKYVYTDKDAERRRID